MVGHIVLKMEATGLVNGLELMFEREKNDERHLHC